MNTLGKALFTAVMLTAAAAALSWGVTLLYMAALHVTFVP